MQIKIFKNMFSIENESVELVERKGIGHPDTLSDILAEAFSHRYSLLTKNTFGHICNHVVDKVTLLGAKANVSFGKGQITQPITCCLFGKITKQVGDTKIDIDKLWQETVNETFLTVFRDKNILHHLKYVIHCHNGIGFDHQKGFYHPSSLSDLYALQEETLRSNDTVMCAGYAPNSETEKLCINLENYLNSEDLKKGFPATGYDIKVLAARIKNFIDLTICIPFIASRTPNREYYEDNLQTIRNILLTKIKILTDKNIDLKINSKDEDGKYAYLTVFGSALDKGDQGAVGRGNRLNGIIATNREMTVEASSGKNPIHHSGKLYNHIAFDIANEIFITYQSETSVYIAARNGDLLHEPAYVFVKTNKKISRNELIQIVKNHLNNISSLTTKIINSNPIKGHIERTYYEW